MWQDDEQDNSLAAQIKRRNKAIEEAASPHRQQQRSQQPAGPANYSQTGWIDQPQQAKVPVPRGPNDEAERARLLAMDNNRNLHNQRMDDRLRAIDQANMQSRFHGLAGGMQVPAVAPRPQQTFAPAPAQAPASLPARGGFGGALGQRGVGQVAPAMPQQNDAFLRAQEIAARAMDEQNQLIAGAARDKQRMDHERSMAEMNNAAEMERLMTQQGLQREMAQMGEASERRKEESQQRAMQEERARRDARNGALMQMAGFGPVIRNGQRMDPITAFRASLLG